MLIQITSNHEGFIKNSLYKVICGFVIDEFDIVHHLNKLSHRIVSNNDHLTEEEYLSIKDTTDQKFESYPRIVDYENHITENVYRLYPVKTNSKHDDIKMYTDNINEISDIIRYLDERQKHLIRVVDEKIDINGYTISRKQ